jgi:acetolactate decarboxylase
MIRSNHTRKEFRLNMNKTVLAGAMAFVGSVALAVTVAPTWRVESAGKLSDIMHKGDYSAKIALADLKTKNHLYALGTMENLNGEVMVIDGKALVATVSHNVPHTDSGFTGNGAMVVWAQVKEWKSITFPDSIASLKELESQIEQLAVGAGINADSVAFPFLIRGVALDAAFHILGSDSTQPKFQTHEEMQASGYHGKMDQEQVVILGFYSKQAAGVFTHHDSFMHAHIKRSDNSLAGHLDEIRLDKGMVLYLPK